MKLCIHNVLSGENQTVGNTVERFLTPYQYSGGGGGALPY